MVANAVPIVAEGSPSALVVGYAHLDGIAAQLREKKVSFVAAALPSSRGPIERWEGRAWERRRDPARVVFAERHLKELSRLLPDEVVEGDVTLSALWKQLRVADDAGGGGWDLPPARIEDTERARGPRWRQGQRCSRRRRGCARICSMKAR
jgi:hypothetical protein